MTWVCNIELYTTQHTQRVRRNMLINLLTYLFPQTNPTKTMRT